jgi:acetolactate synthase-1/2/3 large subunit
MVRVWEELFFEKRITATENIRGPQFAKLAESFGIKGIITNKNNLKSNMKYFLDYKGPILMECFTERDYCFPLVPPGAGLDEMILNKKNIDKLDSNTQAPS